MAYLLRRGLAPALSSNSNKFASTKASLERLFESFKIHGMKAAKVDPLKRTPSAAVAMLSPERFGLTKESQVNYEGQVVRVGELLEQLDSLYCGQMVVDTSAVVDDTEVEWIKHLTKQYQHLNINNQHKISIAKILQKSQCLDNFLGKKFPVLKRYSGEGAEGMLIIVDELLHMMSNDNVEQCIIGMPHRGRNNLLHGQLNFPMELMLRKIKGKSEFPPDVLHTATGDVLSHLNTSTICKYEDGKSIKVNLLPNSSHLEAVNPVVMGKCRARQQTLKDGNYSEEEYKQAGDKVTNILMHGDAAFTGQGIVMEGLNMSLLDGFSVGGTIHIIVNNQVGFTTSPTSGRSSANASDPGRMIGCPVIRVNGDSARDLVIAAQIANEYRRQYRKDVIIDMICYRKWGHNELDDPSFTQPHMYQIIRGKQSFPDAYTQQLIEDGLINEEESNKWKEDEMRRLDKCLIDSDVFETRDYFLQSSWNNMQVASPNHITTWNTGCNQQLLRYIATKSVQVPDTFVMHETLVKTHVKSRIDKITNNKQIDWSTGECMALGSLLLQGYNIRFSGEDVGRGTFSHRHAMLTCQQSEDKYVPLNHLDDNQSAQLEIVGSLLSEEAVLAYEYGFSIENPNRLCIWEAQFGDFFNGAQIQLDAFVLSGEAKWMHQSGLVILLPHGFDGSGPEHSSCRIERFLQCTNSLEDGIDGDSVNVNICNPTKPSQYFHLLRRQMMRNYRKPLIIATPKTLLRSPAATSSLDEMEDGTTFLPIITTNTDNVEPQKVDTMILCSGKHYYTLENERRRLIDEQGRNDLKNSIIVRIEELCPFPSQLISDELHKYSAVKNFIWSQEESRNAGAWNFVSTRMQNILGVKLEYCGRPVHAAVASGIGSVHNEEKDAILRDTFTKS